MGGTYRPLATNKLACSVSFMTQQKRQSDWQLTDGCYHFLLVEGVRRDGGQDQYCAVFVTWYQPLRDAFSFRLPPLQPFPISGTIKQHTRVRARSRRVTGRFSAPWSSCVMRPVNSWWTCSDARNTGGYNSSRYDLIRYTQYQFRYDADPIIVCSLQFSFTINVRNTTEVILCTAQKKSKISVVLKKYLNQNFLTTYNKKIFD